MEQLYKQLFTVIESVCDVVTLEDCRLKEISAITSAGVYICRAMLKIDRNDFMAQSDSSVAHTMQNLHLLQTIEEYARQTLPQTGTEGILPPHNELQRNISNSSETSAHTSNVANAKHLSNELWYIIYTFLTPIARWQLSKTSVQQRALHKHDRAQWHHDVLWATIFQDELWVQKVRDQGVDVVLLTRDFDPLFQSMPPLGQIKTDQKPYIVISITQGTPSGRKRFTDGLGGVDMCLRAFVSCLRYKNIDIKRMEVDFPAFMLNIMDVVRPDQHIYVPDECGMVQSWKIQALFYSTSKKIHIVETSPGYTRCIVHGSEILDGYSFVPNTYGNTRFIQSLLKEILGDRTSEEVA